MSVVSEKYKPNTHPMDEEDVVEDLEARVRALICAGNAIVRAQTQVERVAAMHDWNQLVKSLKL